MAERLVVLKNTGPTPLQFDLYHSIVCARRQRCSCKVDHPGGPKGKPRYNPASFRLAPGQQSDALPAAVLLIPQVKTAKERGNLVVVSDRAQVEVY